MKTNVLSMALLLVVILALHRLCPGAIHGDCRSEEDNSDTLAVHSGAV